MGELTHSNMQFSSGLKGRLSSVEVLAGIWDIYEAPYMRLGKKYTFGPGRHNMPRDFNDRASSARLRSEPKIILYTGTDQRLARPLASALCTHRLMWHSS